MKKILLSAHCKTYEHKNITQVLLKILLSKGHFVDILANFVVDIQQNNVQQVVSTDVQTNDYNIILAYNLKGYQNIRNLAKSKNIPVIYIIKRENYIKEYLYDVSLIYKFLIINDGNSLPRQLFSEDCSIHIPYPYLPPQQNRITTDPPVNILVATDDKTLLKVVPVFNDYGKYNFTIVTDFPSVIKKVVNANCTVVSAKRTNMIESIKNAVLVIGCGLPILASIGSGKSAIVVGEFGFGRRLTPENVEQHLHSLFKGRLGASGEEIIPFHLLSHEIDFCMNAKSSENEAIGNSIVDFLTAKYEQTTSLIDTLICSACTSNSILDMQLRLSSLYRFIAINESSYIVVDNRMMKIHAMVDQDEYDLIHSFEDGSTAGTVMRKSLYHKTTEQFISFIEYLISYKFLVNNDERTNF